MYKERTEDPPLREGGKKDGRTPDLDLKKPREWKDAD